MKKNNIYKILYILKGKSPAKLNTYDIQKEFKIVYDQDISVGNINTQIYRINKTYLRYIIIKERIGRSMFYYIPQSLKNIEQKEIYLLFKNQIDIQQLYLKYPELTLLNKSYINSQEITIKASIKKYSIENKNIIIELDNLNINLNVNSK